MTPQSLPLPAVPPSDLPPPPPGKTGWPWTEGSLALPPALPDGSPWPKISIVTPSFNQAAYLEEALRSVLLQGYPNLEYAVMDGGSADGSADIIRRYTPWLARWASEPDRGQSHAVNKGLMPATGELAGWLNSDDLYAPGALRATAEAFAAAPDAAVIYGNAHLCDTEGTYLADCYAAPFDRELLLNHSNPIPQPAAFFRLRHFQAAGGLDETLHYGMDYDMWLRLERLGRMIYRPQTLAEMRVHSRAKTASGEYRLFAEVRQVVERHGGRGLPDGFQTWLLSTHLPRAFKAYRQGDGQTGRDELEYVLEFVPGWRTDPRRLPGEIANQAWLTSPGLTGDDGAALDFAERVCSQLPPSTASPARVRRQALALLYETLALRNFRRGKRRAAGRAAWRAATYDLARVGNRGTWAILVKSVLAGRRNGAGADAPLEPARRQALKWLSSLPADPAQPYRFRLRAGDEHPTLAASCLAALALSAAGGLAQLARTPEDKAHWGSELLRYQDAASGLFLDGPQPPDAQPHSHWRVTVLALQALDALHVTGRHPLVFLQPYRVPTAAREWLAGLDWGQPSWFISLDWSHPRLAAGAQVMYLVSLLIHEAEHTGDAAYLAPVHAILDWLDERQDARTGFWLLGRGSPEISATAAQAHFAFVYFRVGRQPRFVEQIIDTILGLQQMDGLFDPHSSGSACADYTALRLLAQCGQASGYRAGDIREAMGHGRRAMLQRQNADGSFEGDLRATWLRLEALALIESWLPAGGRA